MKEEIVKSNFKDATKWSMITEIGYKLVTPITNMILARIISPEEFGVIATITMIISFADMFTDAGFQKYLVQHEFKDNNEKFNSANVAFWTNFGISAFLWAIIIIFSDKIANMVGNPGLGHVIAIASFQLILTSFSSIQMALYRRDFDFKTLFSIRMISTLIPFFVTIPLAFMGLSYWSIIIGTIIIQLYNSILLTVKSKWKPKLFYKVSILKEMLSFSIWSLIESISIWFTTWIDMFIIGNALSEYHLGIYKTSTTMVNTIMSLITASIVPVLFTTLSRLQNNKEEFNKIYFNTQRIISILIFPLGIGIYIYRDLVTRILLGSKWVEASAVVGIWALTSSIMIIFGNFCSEVYRAKGKPKLSFMAQLLHLIVLIPVCIISSRYGFLALVYSRSLIRIQFVLVHLVIMNFVVGISTRKTLKNVQPSLISSVIMGISGYMLGKINNSLLWNIISIIICIMIYFIVLFSFDSIRKEFREIIKVQKVKEKIKRYNFFNKRKSYDSKNIHNI